MNNFIIVIGMLTLTASLTSQEEIKTSTKVKEVKVFLKGANVLRDGTVMLSQGKNKVLLENLPRDLDHSTIKLKFDEGVQIKNISNRINFLNTKARSSTIQNLQNKVDSLGLVVEETKMQLGVIQDKIKLVLKNQKVHLDGSTSLKSNLADLLRFYDEQFTQLKLDEVVWKRKLRTQNQEIKNIKNQISETSQTKEEPSLEILVEVESMGNIESDVLLSYYTSQAAWFPIYDARVRNVKENLLLNLKAQVFQSTSEDWENVKLTLSNAAPNESGQMPLLKKWNLTYARWTEIASNRNFNFGPSAGRASGIVVDPEGNPLIGASILVKGTSIGTVTDMAGRFELAIPLKARELVISYIGFNSRTVSVKQEKMQVVLTEGNLLDEVVVTGYDVVEEKSMTSSTVRIRGNNALAGRASGMSIDDFAFNRQQANGKPQTAEVIEKNNAINYEVEELQTLYNNGKPKLVEIQNYDLPAIYEYHAVPKLKSDVYIIAKIPDWDQYYFLAGEMNLYFEESFVGKSVLESKSFEDTLNLSLGIDYNVKILREEQSSKSKKTFLGNFRIDSRKYKIIVNNQKSNAISIHIYDQIPVSIVKDVSVNFENPDDAKVNQDVGKLIWKFQLPSFQKKEITFSYQVKYPRKEKVILE